MSDAFARLIGDVIGRAGGHVTPSAPQDFSFVVEDGVCRLA